MTFKYIANSLKQKLQKTLSPIDDLVRSCYYLTELTGLNDPRAPPNKHVWMDMPGMFSTHCRGCPRPFLLPSACSALYKLWPRCTSQMRSVLCSKKDCDFNDSKAAENAPVGLLKDKLLTSSDVPCSHEQWSLNFNKTPFLSSYFIQHRSMFLV